VPNDISVAVYAGIDRMPERLTFGVLLGNVLAGFANGCPPFFIGRSADFQLILRGPCWAADGKPHPLR
jgi:hypothetical protein